MHTKWIATFLGLKCFAAALLLKSASCAPAELEGNKDIRRNLQKLATTRIIWGNCTNDTDCIIQHSICEQGSCRCSKDYVKLASKCRLKVAIDEECEFDQQCILDGCKVFKECRCNLNDGSPGSCVKNDPMFGNQSGMMKVLLFVTGFVIVATFTCVATLLYKRMKPRSLNRTVSRTPVINAAANLDASNFEAGVNPVPSLDSPPPLYEEVVKSGASTPTEENPPSYGEYLEHQRKNSLQPMIEARNPRIKVISSQISMNDSFIGRF